MTRPKVSPDKRQRTAQACDSCKRRKQKCNGLQPCNTCSKRNLTCGYGPMGLSETSDSVSESYASSENPAKRRNTEDYSSGSGPSPQYTGPGFRPPYIGSPAAMNSPMNVPTLSRPSGSLPPPVNAAHSLSSIPPATGSVPLLSPRPGSNDNPDEEATVYTSARMLQDPSGRLLYIGDSATLSFLQLIRMIVESSHGPSGFTADPARHRIVENSGSQGNLPVRTRHELLPDRATCIALLDSFFIETSGLVEIFNRRAFMAQFEACHADPSNVDGNWLCHLFLVFAIGLVLATPVPGSTEDILFKKLRDPPSLRAYASDPKHSFDRAASFYRTARESCKDPYAQFEDADFWSVQALALMTLYNLAVAKRNAAYVYHGMAIRSAYSLGLHRGETMVIFGEEERATRRNLWRSLFVLDRFLAASLGRPTSISEDDCSGDALNTGASPILTGPFFNTNLPNASTLGLEAAVRSAKVVGIIMKKVYSKRKISAKLAQQIADECKDWTQKLDPSLNWRQVKPSVGLDPGRGVTILHVNLLYCHSIILLTRPFFLHLLHKVQQDRIVNNGQRSQRFGLRMEKFSEACVIASCHSIVLVQNAWDGGYLSRRNPFVSYFLFAATLIILSNEFAQLYDSPSAQACIQSAINITAYCGQGEMGDPLARRLLFILKSFRDVVDRQQESRRIRQISTTSEDPISNLFPVRTDTLPPLFLAPSSTVPPQGLSSSVNNGIERRDSGVQAPAPYDGAMVNESSPSGIPANRSMFSQSPSLMNPPTALSEVRQATGRSPELERQASTDIDSLLGEGEIDFDAFWNMPSAGMTPGIGGTVTPGGLYDLSNIQGISDSIVPLYGVSEF